jgi:thiol:disulfide interchange protein
MKTVSLRIQIAALLCTLGVHGWVAQLTRARPRPSALFLAAASESSEKLAKQVSGEELEIMLTEWEQPLVVDCYATWYVSTVYLHFLLWVLRPSKRPPSMS